MTPRLLKLGESVTSVYLSCNVSYVENKQTELLTLKTEGSVPEIASASLCSPFICLNALQIKAATIQVKPFPVLLASLRVAQRTFLHLSHLLTPICYCCSAHTGSDEAPNAASVERERIDPQHGVTVICLLNTCCTD